MSRSRVIQIVIGLGLLVILGQAAYTVSEIEQVIITQFGDPVGDPVVPPGLHFKVPFIQRTNVFDKRFLEWDGSPNQVPTRDKRFIWVDTYARWRITDPLLFFQRLRDERGAQSRLDDILDGETRNAVARHDLPSPSRWKPMSEPWMPRRSSFWEPTASCSDSWAEHRSGGPGSSLV